MPAWENCSCNFFHINLLHLCYQESYHPHFIELQEGVYILLLIWPIKASYVPTCDANHLISLPLKLLATFVITECPVVAGMNSAGRVDDCGAVDVCMTGEC